jgi:hypothetical protein
MNGHCYGVRLLIVTFALVAAFAAPPASAQPPVNRSADGVAINGYDPVAYFTQNRAVRGIRTNSYDWRESTWLFATPDHRALFIADPERYAPQYGGF